MVRRDLRSVNLASDEAGGFVPLGRLPSWRKVCEPFLLKLLLGVCERGKAGVVVLYDEQEF
jgi:hypothetical protein